MSSDLSSFGAPDFDRFQVIKVIDSYMPAVALGAKTADLTIAHNLGYVPVVFGFVKPGFYYEFPNWLFFTSTTYMVINIWASLKADKTNITIGVRADGNDSVGATEYPIRIYLCRQQGKLV